MTQKQIQRNQSLEDYDLDKEEDTESKIVRALALCLLCVMIHLSVALSVSGLYDFILGQTTSAILAFVFAHLIVIFVFEDFISLFGGDTV